MPKSALNADTPKSAVRNDGVITMSLLTNTALSPRAKCSPIENTPV